MQSTEAVKIKSVSTDTSRWSGCFIESDRHAHHAVTHITPIPLSPETYFICLWKGLHNVFKVKLISQSYHCAYSALPYRIALYIVLRSLKLMQKDMSPDSTNTPPPPSPNEIPAPPSSPLMMPTTPQNYHLPRHQQHSNATLVPEAAATATHMAIIRQQEQTQMPTPTPMGIQTQTETSPLAPTQAPTSPQAREASSKHRNRTGRTTTPSSPSSRARTRTRLRG